MSYKYIYNTESKSAAFGRIFRRTDENLEKYLQLSRERLDSRSREINWNKLETGHQTAHDEGGKVSVEF